MSGDRLIAVLTEIRDQQKQQLENFERALQSQVEYAELQRKGRQLFLFLVSAPWVAVAVLLVALLTTFFLAD